MKPWIIGFFILQIALDLAHSATVFPFVHYGMFSERFTRPDSVEVFEVRVDGRLLRPTDFTIYQWDMVQTPLGAFEKQTATRDYAFDKEKLAAGMRKTGLSSLYNELKPNLDNTGSFISWYKRYLSGLVGHPIATVQANKAWYRWSAGRLRLIRTETFFNG